MANITFLEPGTDATFDLTLWTTVVGGAPVSSSAQSYTGPRSLKMVLGDAIDKESVLRQAGNRISFRVRFDDITTAPGILQLVQATVAVVLYVNMNSSGQILLFNSAVTLIGTGSTALSSTTWYRIAIAYTITSSSVNEIRLWVHTGDDSGGTPEISLSNVTLPSTALNLFRVVGGSATAYFDDFYIDDGTTLDDPGAIRVTAKRPASHDVNQFDVAIGANPANRWTNVNERPLSQTNGWESSGGGVQRQESYGIEAAASGDVDISSSVALVGYGGWLLLKANAEVGGYKLIVNGSQISETVLTVATLYTTYATSATYPGPTGSIIGWLGAVGDNLLLFFYECGILIAYTPSGPSAAQETPAIEQFAGSGGMVGRAWR